MSSNENKYIKHYKNIDTVYPSAFALKVFLGKMEGFSFRDIELTKQKILDVGFGDGRDLVLFSKLGMDVYGCEPEEAVVKNRINRFQKAGIKADLKIGNNMHIPFQDEEFDIVYSAGALYYMPSDQNSIHGALNEAGRVLKSGGYLVTSLVSDSAHYIPSAKSLGSNLYKLTDPFFKQRNGQVIHAYNNMKEIETDMAKHDFTILQRGKFDVDWFGVNESLFLVIAKKL